jgi:hypothetical protein
MNQLTLLQRFTRGQSLWLVIAVALGLALGSQAAAAKESPPCSSAFPSHPSRGLPPQGTPAALPSPILRRPVQHQRKSRCAALRLAACRGVSEGWPMAEACGQGGGAKRAFVLPIR